MATLSTPATAANANSQVPLDTIPVSPAPNGASANGPNTEQNEGDAGQAGGARTSEDELITVFHDKDNFNVVHPLMNEWTLWFTKPPSGKGDNWTDLLKEVVTFNSVEQFWGVYNNITPVSELSLKSDYHLFKKGVRPEWEDPQNKHGGKWSYSFKGKSAPIDNLWLQVTLAAIGETLENEGDGEVMGVVVNVRRGFYRIGLWTKTVGKSVPGAGEGDVAGGKGRSPEKSKGILEEIGRKLKEVLILKDSEVVEFTGHTEAAHAGSTRAKPKFTV